MTGFNLPLPDLRGQTHDGASNMLGKRSSVAVQIKRVQPKATETHCHGHSLNLLVKDATKSNRLINDVLEIVVEKENFEMTMTIVGTKLFFGKTLYHTLGS